MKPLNLQRLEIFRRVYELRNVSKAAQELKFSQPTVSRHLRTLERELGLSLFENVGGRMKPTYEANRLYSEGQGVFSQIRQLEQSINRIRRGRGDAFRIMVAPSLAVTSLVPLAIRELLEEQPDLDISVDVGGSAAQMVFLRDGTIDIGIAGGLEAVNEFDIQKIQTYPVVGLVADGHPLQQESVFHWSHIEKFDCVVPSEFAPIGRIISNRIREMNLRPNRLITAVAPPLAVALVEQLKCCTIIDRMTADIYADRKVSILPMSEDLSIDVQTVRLKGKAHRNASDIFIKAIKSIVSDISAHGSK